MAAAFEGGVKAFVGVAYFDEVFERVEIDLVIDGDFPLFALDVVVVDGAVLAAQRHEEEDGKREWKVWGRRAQQKGRV